MYIGVDCTNGYYFTTIKANENFDETLDMTNEPFTGICFTNTLTSLKLTIGDSIITTNTYSHFRYFPSSTLTKNSEIRDLIGREVGNFSFFLVMF